MDPSRLKENIGQGTLQMLGKQAAAKYLRSDDDLTTCVVRIIKEANAQVTKEHVQRICEFANHTVWSHIFRGSDKTAGIRGGPADAERASVEIYQTGDRPTPHRHHSDYAKRPSDIFKTAESRYSKYATGPEYEAPEPDAIKTASMGNPMLDALAGLGVDHSNIQDQMYNELKHAREYYTGLLKQAELQHQRAADDLVQASYQAYFDGHSYQDMCGALKPMVPEHWVKQACLDFIGMGLLRQGLLVRPPSDTDFDAAPVKLAHPQHPLVEAFVRMKKTAEDYMAAHLTLAQMEPLWQQIRGDMVEKTAGVLDVLGKITGGVIGGAGRGVGFLAEQGGNLLARGGSLLGQAATKHPAATVAALGGGYVFGPEVARRVGLAARDTGHQIVQGVTQPLTDFGDYEHPQFGTLNYGYGYGYGG